MQLVLFWSVSLTKTSLLGSSSIDPAAFWIFPLGISHILIYLKFELVIFPMSPAVPPFSGSEVRLFESAVY